MNEDLILSNLIPIAEEFGVTLDLTEQDSELSVFINRNTETHPDYPILTSKLAEAIADLPFLSITGIFFYSRLMGTSDPDMASYIDLSPTPETEHEYEEPYLPEDEETSAFDLSKYSFVPNQSLLGEEIVQPPLLEEEIVQPPPEIAVLIFQIHQLSNIEKLQFVSILEQGINNLENCSLIPNKNVKNILETIAKFKKKKQRKALTWISRYCANPEQTIAEIDIPEEEDEFAIDNDLKKLLEEDPELNQARAALEAIRAKSYQSGHQETYLYSHSYPSRSKIPVSWLIVWTIFIFMVIGTLLHSNSAAKICDNSSSQYCQLAVEITGAKTLQKEAKNALPITPELASEFESICLSRGYIQAGITLKTLTQGTIRTPISSGEEILSGIYVVDLRQANYNTESDSERVACILKALRIIQPIERPQIKLIAAEVIPENWPKKPYKRPITSPADLEDALGIFGILTVLGTGTLFTAIGIILANMTGFGIQVNRMETIVKAAFFLGILETSFMFIPFANLIVFTHFFVSLALESIALLITSSVIKDFRIDWAAGYRLVLAGSAIIIGTRMMLNLLLISVISAII